MQELLGHKSSRTAEIYTNVSRRDLIQVLSMIEYMDVKLERLDIGRHSYATHLHETGLDKKYMQELLGHKSSRTAEIYTHVS
jgi:site-specific recombinase XerD